MNKIELESCLESGVTYLDSVQQPDGSFLSLSSNDPIHFRNPYIYQTTFTSSLILLALTNVSIGEIDKRIKKKNAQFLLKQKSDYWSWNYWNRNSKEAKELLYPDDLDDTFCALAALQQYDKSLIDGKAMAAIVLLLTTTEHKEGGPYRTWLVDKQMAKNWGDIDIAVNSNIAFFLSLQEIFLPKLNTFLKKKIATHDISSPYYPSLFPILYFLSRFIKGKSADSLISLLFEKKQKNHSWGNPLDTALAISALLNLKVDHKKMTKSISYLLKKQTKGVFAPYPFCFDPSLKNKKYFSGSSSLTTAFCLEAISKYQQLSLPHFLSKKERHAESIYNQILMSVNQKLSYLNQPMKKTAKITLTEILKKDQTRQIPLLPYYFSLALTTSHTKISKQLLIDLGVANIFGWLAYTIYDNFLDEEGNPQQLSVANFSLRQVTSIMERILPRTAFADFFRQTMNKLDAANLWEVTYCRTNWQKTIIPNYKNYQHLADKSLGHALGPVAILFSLGFTQKDLEVKQTLQFFTHYLIARQLNDDAHDWQQDLERGQINAVGALILQTYQKKRKAPSEIISLKQSLPKLQKLFWYIIMPEIYTIVTQKVLKAKQALHKNTLLTNTEHLEKFVVKYADAMQLAIRERDSTLQFIKYYGK